MFYYTLAQQYPERLPSKWTEFEELLIKRFSSRTPVETLQRLLTIKFRDSVTEVTNQFARVCAEGDPLPQEKLIHVYLSRFPKTMVMEAMKRQFSTWVEASEFMQNENRQLTMRLAEWYQLAPVEFKREVEADVQNLREGWILKTNITGSKQQTAAKTNWDRRETGNYRTATGVKTTRGEIPREVAKDLKLEFACHHCQGRGHKARDCPSRVLATRKEGSRCNKCGGMGHWAPACPSPRTHRGQQEDNNTHTKNMEQGNEGA